MQKVTASIITIGDELLIGQVVDTNSAWMSQQLNNIGVWVQHRVAVGDVRDDIWNALDEESKRSDIILITGGLGPTADDITKPLLCEYFGGKLIMHQPTLDHVTYLFEHVFKRLMPLLDRNRKQAEVPDVCTVLKNERGTAPGMLFEKDGKIFISMPGVPHEMQGIMKDHVFGLIKQRYEMPHIGHRTLLTAGQGESMLAEMIQNWEEALPGFIKLAYLPNYGMVRLRLTGSGEIDLVEHELDRQFALLKEQVKDYLVVDEDIPMHEVVGRMLKAAGKTATTAESCTGGYISHLITSVPGSSNYFYGSIVSYDNRIKENILHVKKETLQTFGAVSEETVIEMAQGVLQLMQTDYAIAVSGIMGPDGGSEEKPVGTVWIAVGNNQRIETKKLWFRFDRKRNIELTSINALNLLRIFILKTS
ncbi:CinA family nicotinamide mononucleotide deamidase-related protein [Panacibacter ginsenosidivorans]|uniref:CinA-like protein n=1 Tax=Panacibacter ginsenosidivorans TaxID=1813871 RepID=A0A5B8VFR3_9BACT|nr:CinA family nicotinamide mononucleotide deamidase-related protein [Panacibacter ginsenosidivorans]QEC69963.1 CinA family nicotinamide mononucleotide deamidase-related protein [Panacibacter ginsenosidivorans]